MNLRVVFENHCLREVNGFEKLCGIRRDMLSFVLFNPLFVCLPFFAFDDDFLLLDVFVLDIVVDFESFAAVSSSELNVRNGGGLIQQKQALISVSINNEKTRSINRQNEAIVCKQSTLRS